MKQHLLLRYAFFLSLLVVANLVFGQNAIYSEDFNSCELPSDWTVNLIGDGPANFHLTDSPDAINPNADGSTIDGSCLVLIDDDAAGQNAGALVTQLITPPFDATVNSTIRLSVDVHFREVYSTAFRIKVFDGTEFVEILELTTGSSTGEQLSDYFTFASDLSFYANENMQIMFEYDDDNGDWGWWAAFDNIQVTGEGEATNIILEDFNDCEMPTNWVTNIVTGEADWQFGLVNNGNANTSSMNGTCFAYFDDDGLGEDAPSSSAILASPPFDGTQFANFYLDFDVIVRRFGDLENLTVGVLQGTEFVPVNSYLTDLGGPQFDAFINERIDLSAFRAPVMRVVFIYDDGDTWGWWTGIDNVKISGEGAINDLCENAFDLNLDQPCLEGNNLTALFTGNEPPCALQSTGSLWYRYEATTTGLVEIKTNATFNDVVTVFESDCATLNELLCDNWDEFGFVSETTEFQAIAGQTYSIRVSGAVDEFGAARGDLCIQLTEIPSLPTPPANDICANAVELTLDSDCLSGNNYHATLNWLPPTTNEKSKADIWYRFTATVENIELISNADFSDVMAVYTGDCGNLSEIATNDFGQKTVLENLTLGENYYLSITGNFATVEGNVCVKMQEFEQTPPANDDCAAAMSLSIGEACLEVTNVGANYSGIKPSCEVTPSADVWFEFIAPNSGTIQINTGATFVHVLSLYQGDCNNLQEVSCHQNPLACEGFVTIGSLIPNEPYLLQIATASDIIENAGQGNLCLSILDGNEIAPLPLTISLNIECVSEGTGQLAFETTGGLPPYTYQGNNNGEVLQSGETYLIIVQDASGCEKSLTGTVSCGTSNCNLSLLPTITNATCNAANNGTASVAVENSNGNSTFLWSNGETTPTITNLSPGGYTVTVTDDIGCEMTTIITIEEPAVLLPEANSTNETAFNANDGTVAAHPIGGTEPYNYEWSNGSTSQSQNGLAPGSYTVTITDANACQTEQLLTVAEFTCTLTAAITAENITCNNAENGIATILAEAGTTPYNIVWSNGQTGASISDLSPGTYTATVTDAADCPSILSVEINQPMVLVANAMATGETSSGANNGTAIANPTGGTSPYAYEWSNGETVATLSNLAPGNYTVTLTDGNGCQTQETVSVNAFNCALEVQVSEVTNVSCNDGNNGSITVLASNGVGNLTYELADGTTSVNGVFNNLPADNFTITVNDDAGCSFVVNATIDQPPVLQANVLNQTNVDCATNEIGAITLNANGGTAPYAYHWNNGLTGESQSDLAAGLYAIDVSDANDCMTQIEVEISIEDNENPIVSTQNLVVELDENGAAVITIEDVNNGSSDNCGIETIDLNIFNFNCSNLGENEVVLTVADVNGNVNSATATITIQDNSDPVFDCLDDIVSADCSGFVEYNLPSPSDNCSASAPVLIEGLASGEIFPNGVTTVTHIVTDFGGNTTTCSFLVTVENPLAAEFLIEKPTCFGLEDGEATVTVTGGTGNLTYSWSTGGETATISELIGGTYEVTVTDELGCEIVATAVVPDPPNVLFTVENIVNESNTGSLDGDIDIAIEGGTPPFSFEWYLNGALFATGQDISGLPGGDYQLLVYDENGCIYASDVITIETLVGVDNLDPLAGKVDLFPNPTSGKFALQLDLVQQSAVEITIYDVAGRALLFAEDAAVTERNFDFDLTEWASGVYQVKILVEETVLVKKLVKE